MLYLGAVDKHYGLQYNKGMFIENYGLKTALKDFIKGPK